MRLTQRFVMLLEILFMIALCSIYMLHDSEEYLVEQWENVCLERFIGKICKNGSVSYEDFLLFHNSLSAAEDKFEIRIEEYREEQNLNRNYFYVPVIWVEIRDILWRDKHYSFSTGSMVKVEVIREKMVGKRTIRRICRISERTDNDT